MVKKERHLVTTGKADDLDSNLPGNPTRCLFTNLKDMDLWCFSQKAAAAFPLGWEVQPWIPKHQMKDMSTVLSGLYTFHSPATPPTLEAQAGVLCDAHFSGS